MISEPSRASFGSVASAMYLLKAFFILVLIFSTLCVISVVLVWDNRPDMIHHSPLQAPAPFKSNKCSERNADFKIGQRGAFFVLYNYVKAKKKFACHESVTYTTQGDYSFLDNIPTLISRWKGPVSLALYAPGDDFKPTIESIAYLRNCETPLIREYVTFHIFFIEAHIPTQKSHVPLVDVYEDIYDCSRGAPYHNVAAQDLYKRRFNLTYPINVARNIARVTATTHYIFASDIELYPTPHLIPKFLAMLEEHPEYAFRKNPRVYALPIFEILSTESVPENKTQLQGMTHNGTAFLFHRKLCPMCHAVPQSKEWMAAKETTGLHVFTVGKRMHLNKVWEAFYIGTHHDPLFDERLTWEGQSNKMTQGYSLCLLNYDYMVLDNAFLIHKPGIKKSKEQVDKYNNLVHETNILIRRTIKPQLIAMYGYRDGCYL